MSDSSNIPKPKFKKGDRVYSKRLLGIVFGVIGDYCELTNHCDPFSDPNTYQYSVYLDDGSKRFLYEPDLEFTVVKKMEKQVDLVNHPPHYRQGKIQPIEVIEDWQLGFCLGNVLRYLCRHGKKDGADELQDLKKAEWYLKRRIQEIENV